MISIIAALAANGAIGTDNKLLLRMPNDMKRFKQFTTGHTVIMGRKTFESLPKGALPDRTNVVITRNPQASFDGCATFHQLDTAINHYQHENEIFIIGGASIYQQAIGSAGKLYLTSIRHSFENADAFFPEIIDSEWIMTEYEEHPSDEHHLYPYTFKTLIKKK